jgi:uncharacterized protein YqeY
MNDEAVRQCLRRLLDFEEQLCAEQKSVTMKSLYYQMILRSYLAKSVIGKPKYLRSIVDRAILNIGATNGSQFNQVMGIIIQDYGKGLNVLEASKMVKSILGIRE